VMSSLSFMKESSWGKPQMSLISFMVKSKSVRVVGEPRNKVSVKIDKADKRLHLLFI
jgi:hypothetical protein